MNVGENCPRGKLFRGISRENCFVRNMFWGIVWMENVWEK